MEELIGKSFNSEIVVTPDMLASAAVEGTPNVFSTPRVVALIEQTAYDMLKPFYGDGETSVGVNITLNHLNPTPLGGRVVCTVKVTRIEKRMVFFDAEVVDNAGIIANAMHSRAIVLCSKIEQKAASRL